MPHNSAFVCDSAGWSLGNDDDLTGERFSETSIYCVGIRISLSVIFILVSSHRKHLGEIPVV